MPAPCPLWQLPWVILSDCLLAASSQADCSADANTLPLLVFAYKQKRLLLECTACVPTLWLLLPCSHEKLLCSLRKEHTKMNATSSDDLVNFMAAPTTRRQALNGSDGHNCGGTTGSQQHRDGSRHSLSPWITRDS